MAADARRKLVDFVVERAFDPVVKAKSGGRSESERRKLEDVQNATRTAIERYRNYESAKEVVVNFRRDLNSEPAEKIHAELKALNLPTVNDLRDEFEKKAEELGVKATRPPSSIFDAFRDDFCPTPKGPRAKSAILSSLVVEYALHVLPPRS